MRLNNRGFSLVEIIVVVALFGVVSTVILDLYLNVQRSTVTSEEVVEVQQGMRLALDQMARDIQMAGFLVPTNTPITVAQNNLISLETASPFGAVARIPMAVTFAAGTPAVAITVNKTMADLFRVDNFVRIVIPSDGCQPTSTATNCARDGAAPRFLITGIADVSPATNPPTTTLTLKPAGNLTNPASSLATPVTIPAESMIVRVPSPTDDPTNTYPSVITYSLEDDPNSDNFVLSRNWASALTATERIIATNITPQTNKPGFTANFPGLRFEYFLMDNAGVTTVLPSRTAAAGTALTAAQRERIVAVRIFMTGQTENAKPGQEKTREIETTVKIRNI